MKEESEFKMRVEVQSASADGKDYVIMTKEMYDDYKHAYDLIQRRNRKAREYMKNKYDLDKADKYMLDHTN